MSTTVQTVTLSDHVVKAAAMIGRLVTVSGYGEGQFKIYSIEGPDYYAFQSDVQTITIDPTMTRATWMTEPVAMILPTWAKIGQGFGFEAPLSRLHFRVSLVKTWV